MLTPVAFLGLSSGGEGRTVVWSCPIPFTGGIVVDAVERVRAALDAAGVDSRIVRFPAGTKTAGDAARAIGTTVGRIVKSLVFMAGGKPVCVLASGGNRVDSVRLADIMGCAVRLATPDEVFEHTGFVVGGVAPVGHSRPVQAVCDQDLTGLDVVYCAAGTADTVFAIEPGVLVRITQARVARIDGQRREES